MNLVIDASTTAAWAFEDEATPEIRELLRRVRDDGASVPAHWPFEVANALLVGERRGRIAAANVTLFLGTLATFPIEIDGDGQGVTWGWVLSLAREQKLTVYDAAYLELAARLGLPLATNDAALQTAAQAIGVPLA